MVKNFDGHRWQFKVFAKYIEDAKYTFVDVDGMSWQQMRPLTTAERDAIKVKD